ncbi:SlyX family protein [Deinococcus sp. Marseille-Q6407]|uniref:SlyX family protein n=1 Tax=Deinococcus sp. Marseille-Q6407 TaxID=2969223 RepID=UPI0021BE895C|nr:SlyX family protein [Deinococcus sp. Marseille-Q6407]
MFPFIVWLVLAGALAALAALWRRVARQQRELDELRAQVQALSRQGAAARPSAPPPGPAAPTRLETPEKPAQPSELDINFLRSSWSVPPEAGNPEPTPHVPASAPQPRASLLSGGQWFAALGGLLTLLGLGAVLSQLVRAGFFTPQLQLGAAFALAAALYALAERARPAVAAVLRGLGYGTAALAFGAMFQAGTLPALAVLGLTGLLSLLVGWHAWQRREPLTLLVALSGTTLACWLLADDLAAGQGTLGAAQLALLAVFAATLWSVRRGPAPHHAAPLALQAQTLLPLLLPLGLLGLWVSAQAHGLSGESWLWVLLGTAGLLGLAWPPTPGAAAKTAPASLNAAAVQAAALLALSGTAAAPLLAWLPLNWAPLLTLWAATGAALILRARHTPLTQPDLLRDAQVCQALGLGASLTQRLADLSGGVWAAAFPEGLRLLPYALLASHYGRWSGAKGWQ